MPKHEGKGVSIKSMTMFVVIILTIASALLMATYYGFSWWRNNSLETRYQPKYAGDVIAAKLSEFVDKNNRYPSNSQELLNYLSVAKPVFVSAQGAFRLKNYAYSYRVLGGEKGAVLWAIPSPKDNETPPSDTENFNQIEQIRQQSAVSSTAYFIVLAPKQTRKFQGNLTQKVSDIDSLPSEPTTNQLNSAGLFEKR